MEVSSKSNLSEATKSITGKKPVRRRRLIKRDSSHLKPDIHRQRHLYIKTTQALTLTNVMGGVGKTTMTILIAQALTQLYKNTEVLLVDMDPEKHLTAILAPKVSPETPSLYDMLFGTNTPEGSISKTWIPNVDIIPGAFSLQDMEKKSFKKNTAAVQKVRQKLNALKQIKYYRFIMYDTPSAATILTTLALSTSNYYIPIVNLDRNLIKSLQATEILAAYVSGNSNTDLKRLGILINKYSLKGRNHTAQFMNHLEEDWPDGTLITPPIPKTIGIEKSSKNYGTILMVPEQYNFRAVRSTVLSVAREIGERVMEYSKGRGGDIVNEAFLYKEYWG